LEEQLGERRQQPVWRRCRRHGRVAAIERFSTFVLLGGSLTDH
jgi:hypothetical protein